MGHPKKNHIADSEPTEGSKIAAPRKLVASLIRKSNETKTRMQSEAGELREEIKGAVDARKVGRGISQLYV